MAGCIYTIPARAGIDNKRVDKAVIQEKQMRIACYIRCNTTFDQVQRVLARIDFHCERFLNEASLLVTLRRQSFDLILVDTEFLDEQSFYSWLNCRTGEGTPLVLLSDAWNANQIAFALEAGADDFIRRPVDPVELTARLQAILRRYHKTSSRRTIELLEFKLDRDAGRA
jgi:DNA-binding response OmpR family regulator